MKKLLSVLLLASTAVHAQDEIKNGAYVGVGVTGTAVELEYAGDAAVNSASFKAGYAFNKHLAIEGRIVGASSWDDIGYDGIYAEQVRLDSTKAVYARVSLGNPTFDPYLLIGYATSEATVHHQYWGGNSVTKSSVAVGAGANWKINNSFSLTGDWTIPTEDAVQFNLGIDYNF